MANTDADLVNQVKQGDQRAFAMLFARYEKPIYNLACRMAGDADEAADIAQRAFVKAYLKIETFNPAFSFFSWLYRIAVNESLNLLAQRQRRRNLAPESFARVTTPEDDFRAQETSDLLQRALLAMTFDQRVVIVLKHLLLLPYHDIAGILDLPEKTVKSRLFSARQVLKQQLIKQGYAA